MRSLQARMFLVFALIATLPLLAMSYLALNATRTALADEVGRANGDAAQAAAGFVDVYVENARVLLEAEARAPSLRDALAADDDEALLGAARELQERAAYRGGRLFQATAVFDAEGTLLAAWPMPSAPTLLDAHHAALVEAARASGAFATVPVPREGPPVLPLAAPVVANGTLRGVVVGDVSLAALARGLAPFAAAHQTVFLTDDEGVLLAHPDADVLAARPDWSGLEPVRSALAPSAARNYVEYDDPVTGERALASFATVPRLGWIVYDSVPTSVAYGALQQLTAVLIALSGLLVGAILLASVGVARRIVAPVQELTAASRELAEGKLGRRVRPAGDDEIAELGRAFDQMADRISESLEGLRRSESRYRSLVESASDLIFTVQPDGELSFASPMMRGVLGAAARPGAPAASVVHPDDRAAFQEAVARVVERAEPALFVPFRLVGEGGVTRAVLTNFTPIFEAGDRPVRVLAVAHDVTEERRQAELREQAFQMARLVNEETELERLARRGLQLALSAARLPSGAVLLLRGNELHEAAAEGARDPAGLRSLAERARRDARPARGEVQGEAAIAVPLVEHGEVLGALVLAGDARDIDAAQEGILPPLATQLAVGLRRSLFEARLKEHAAELETRVAERTRELTQKSAEMEQFLYSVSHDLKAPLISIQGYAQGLEEEHAHALQGDGARYLERIRANATLMESLILDILELSRIGRTREGPVRIDMERLLRDVASRVGDRFTAAGGELRLEPPFGEIEAEPKRVAQMFSNLLDNALKYRHPDRPPRVRIWADADPDAIRYHVQDNGRGIPTRYHDQIFKIFQRVPAPGMHDPGGTGMGLAIVKRISETQGGRVWFESQEHEGTTFHVELPRRNTARDDEVVS